MKISGNSKNAPVQKAKPIAAADAKAQTKKAEPKLTKKEIRAAAKQARIDAKNAEKQAKKNAKAAKRAANAPKRKRARIIALVAVIVLAGAFFGIGAYAASGSTIYKGVTMEGIDLSGLTAEEAADALASSDFGSESDKTLEVTLPAGVTLSVSAKDAGVFMSAPDAASFVYELCHGSNFFTNTTTYFRSLFGGLELTTGSGAELDSAYLNSTVEQAVRESELALMDNSIDVGEESVTIVKGANSATINGDELYDKVEAALVSGNFAPFTFEAQSNGEAVEPVDLQAIYDMVYAEPKNAEYDADTGKATEHVTGRSFDMDEAQRLWDAAATGEMVVIPLILEQPEVTTESLESMLFSEVLAQKSTSLSGSSSARINNITKAAAAINGIIMNPGDEFSYNEALGQRTAKAGYQGAGAYSGGKVVTEIGGGICQVSSTLYYCALISNLEITSRTCHYFGVSYLPAGLDATVSWPSPDFKFKNDGEYPIKIEAYVKDGSVTVAIHGSNPEGIRVEMTTSSFSVANGYGAVSYRNIYDKNGKLISSKEEARSTYHYHVEEEEPSPSPSESVEPSIVPSTTPTVDPSGTPSVVPSVIPSVIPTAGPTITPTEPVAPTATLPVVTPNLATE